MRDEMACQNEWGCDVGRYLVDDHLITGGRRVLDLECFLDSAVDPDGVDVWVLGGECRHMLWQGGKVGVVHGVCLEAWQFFGELVETFCSSARRDNLLALGVKAAHEGLSDATCGANDEDGRN